MRKIPLMLWAAALLAITGGCGPSKLPEPETGVSRELARQRKENIGKVEYTLSFTIPEEREADVWGNVKITMDLAHVEPVVVDFREDSTHVRQLTVNGKPAAVHCINEHIVVPREGLHKGSNEIEIDFIAGNQSLNRNDEYLYTLLVPERARTLFPCFDQPDMKATFRLTLDLPGTWEAVANAPLLWQIENEEKERKVWTFDKTLPISTYLFSFVAGKWQKLEETRDGRTIAMYYRETDPQKIAQSPVIFDQVFASLQWMEAYTGVPLPFPKYDFVAVPGFQFGGMEHPGAVLYKDNSLFLGLDPTPAALMARRKLIAHETAHLWFGDAVTMEWFNDVWTKEVFANYLSTLMTADKASTEEKADGKTGGGKRGIDKASADMRSGGKTDGDEQTTLNELCNFYRPAYAENRTAGATSIKQELPNLEEAGLIYGQMVYEKAPIVMRMLVDRLGAERFREGIGEYVRTYLYGNSTWEDLIAILDRYTDEDLVTWSDTWVKEKSMPVIAACYDAGKLVVRQDDPSGQGLVWAQDMEVTLLEEDGTATTGWKQWKGSLALDSAVTVCALDTMGFDHPYLLPNTSGKAYGYFALDERTISYVLQHFDALSFTSVERLSLLVNLYENYLHGKVDARRFAQAMLDNLQQEQEPFIITASLGYLREMASRGPLAGDAQLEQGLWALARSPKGKGCQKTAFSTLVAVCRRPDVIADLYRIWETRKPYPGLTLSESGYMQLAYELSIRLPERYETLKNTQAARIADPDRNREFQFVIRSVDPDKSRRDALFNSLLVAENRRMEPWVAQALHYLNHPLRQQEALPYLLPGLQVLRDVQRTGDIFFPKNWAVALLDDHSSIEAAHVVETFLADNPDYPILLKNKILQAADHLLRLEEVAR